MTTDEELHERVQAGDAAAFDELYARYELRLFAFLRSQLPSQADAEDAFHEAFLRALTQRSVRFEGPGAFRAWLFRVAKNEAANRQRGDRRRLRAVAALPEPPPCASAEAALEGAELTSALGTAVANLPPALAEVYHLRVSGLRYEEIAAVARVPVGTIKSRAHALVARLQQELVPWIAKT